MSARKLYGTTPEMVGLMLSPSFDVALPLYETFRQAHGFPYPKDATKEITALAMVHKARLVWQGSTKAMIRESKAWLVAHGMSPSFGSSHNGTVQ